VGDEVEIPFDLVGHDLPLRLLSALKLFDCSLDSFGKRKEIAFDDVPNHLRINGVVLVPDGITKGPNVRPWLIGRELFDNAFQFPGGLRNTQQTTFYGIASLPIFNEIAKTKAFRVLKYPVNILENVIEPLDRLVRRQGYDPSRSRAAAALSR
jgi:hypothetical protein